MVRDRGLRLEAELRKRQIFIEANRSRMQEKAVKTAVAESEKRQETYDYFPFTHGDQIEQYQEELKKSLLSEMNASVAIASANSPVKAHVEPTSVVTKMPISHYTEYPVFLRQDEYHPVRRIEDTHVNVTMQEALKRYEDNIVKLEQEQEKREIEAQRQADHNQQYFETQLQRRAQQIEDNKQYLQQQIKERESIKRLEKTQQREPVRTNYGPEETPEDYAEEEERKKRIKQEVRETLYTQMKSKFEKDRTHKTQERAEDIENLIIATEIIAQEAEKAKSKEQKAKELYKDAWEKQMQMKELEKAVEMIL
mmetsp:Transcript_13178/g.24662  ORF Transcript_13178/g.24662 Transcript_13178/m.24662 type:complete len:310 (-) Transcript_13178:37-966(-)